MLDNGSAGGMGVGGATQKALDVGLLSKAAAHIDHLLESPDWVLDATTVDAQKAALEARKLVKLFFDAAQARCPPRLQKLSNLGPRGLVLKGFNNEQIWEELEVQNIPLRRHLRARIAKVVQGKVSLKAAAGDRGELQQKARSKSSREEDLQPEVKKKGKKKAEDDAMAGAEVQAEASGAKSKKKKGKSKKGDAGSSASEGEAGQEKQKAGFVDPFSVEEMNRFADLAEAEGGMRLDEDAEESDFGILEAGSDEEDGEGKTAMFSDFFKTNEEEMQDVKPKSKKGKKGSEEEEEDADDDTRQRKKEKKSKAGKKEDLSEEEQGLEDALDAEMDEEDGEEEEEDDDEEIEEEAFIDGAAAGDDLSDEEKELEAKLNQLQAADEGDEDDEEGDEDDTDGEGKEAKEGEPAGRSLYDMDKNLRTLEEDVAKLEEEQLEEKSWELKGEVSARQRPLNSLLETHLEKPMSFFAGNRAASAAEQTAGASEDEAALEDVRGAAELAPRKKLDIDAIVRQRIWDEVFDDVVRKFHLPPSQRKRKEDEDVVETLNFEKSRVGLGDIYAKQYEAELLGHKTDEQEKEDKDKVEAKSLFSKLMFKLDQLTNAHFTPRPPMLGVANDALAKVPALKMEETIPLMVSDAHLKAPEEVKAPRRHEREQEELTHDERSAKRRLKKAKRRKEQDRKLDKGSMTLADRRDRTEALMLKNKEAKLEKEKKGTPKEAKKKIKGSELMAQAQEQATTAGVSRKEMLRKERNDRPEGAPTSKKFKL